MSLNQKGKMGLFSDHKIFLLPSGIGKARLDLFRRRVEAQGGTCFTDFKLFVNDSKSLRESGSSKAVIDNQKDSDGSEASANKWNLLVVAEDSMKFEVVTKLLKLKLPQAKLWFVKTKWLSDCLKEEEMKDPGDYITTGAPQFSLPPALPPPLAPPPLFVPTLPPASCVNKLNDCEEVSKPKVQRLSNEALCSFSGAEHSPSVAEYSTSAASDRRSDPIEIPQTRIDTDLPIDTGDGIIMSEAAASKSGFREPLPPGNWVCTQASARQGSSDNKNSFVISQLEQLCKVYKTTKDQWRQLSYRKAISG